MHRTLSREELSFCIPSFIQLFCKNCGRGFSIGCSIVDHINVRNYSSKSLLDPTSKNLSAKAESYNLSFKRDSSHFVIPPKFRTGETYSVLDSEAFQPLFKNWQQQRKHKLTASTFAGAVGFWRGRRVQLWLEKLGAIEPFSGNLATCWSNMKEEEALEKYKLITGNTVSFPEFQVYGVNNSEDDWLAASPDGVIYRLVDGLPSQGVLEIKCPFFDGNMNKFSPWKRIPLYHIPQAQGLMEILDRDWLDFYVWTPVGSSLFRLYRDVEYWDALKMALSDFWWKHVQPAKEICSRSGIKNLPAELKLFKPAPRHELCSYMVYESKRIVDSSRLLLREIHGKLQN